MIALEDVRKNVYENFLESMRSSETMRMYVRNIRKFLNLIPNNIFEEYLGESQRKRLIKSKAMQVTHTMLPNEFLSQTKLQNYQEPIKNMQKKRK